MKVFKLLCLVGLMAVSLYGYTVIDEVDYSQATAWNNQRHLVCRPTGLELHAVYNRDDTTFVYVSSPYTGQPEGGSYDDWVIRYKGLGHHPSIAVDSHGDVVIGRIIYRPMEPDPFKYRYQVTIWNHFAECWDSGGIYVGSGSFDLDHHSMAVMEVPPDSGDMAKLWVGIALMWYDPDSSICQLGYAATTLHIKADRTRWGGWAAIARDQVNISEGELGFPALVWDMAEYPPDEPLYMNILWQKRLEGVYDEEIFYGKNAPFPPPSSGPVSEGDAWAEYPSGDPLPPLQWGPLNLSRTRWVPSTHPFIELYGDKLYATWTEGEPGEVVRRYRYLTDPYNKWSDRDNISQTPDQHSDWGVQIGWIPAWQESEPSDDEIYWSPWGYPLNLSQTNDDSRYPHISWGFPQGEKVCALWTEGSQPPYKIAFLEVDVPEPPGGPQTAGTGKPLEPSILQITPSPFSHKTTIRYQISKPADRITLRIYDVSGRMVKDFAGALSLVPGAHSVVWDGRDDSGQPLPSGVYFLRLETDASRLTRKAVLTR